MKLTSKKIMDIYNCFRELADKELDFDTSCTIADNIKNLSTANQIVEKKINELADKYAARDENHQMIPAENGGFRLAEETILEYQQKIAELFHSETDVTVKPIVKKSLSEIKVSPKLILILKENDLITDTTMEE